MLILDDALLFPVRGIFLIFREIYNAALQELAGEAEAIRAQLAELYLLLATGRTTEAEFDRQEKELLDRLDALEARGSGDKAPRR
jgi:hypothetical protein